MLTIEQMQTDHNWQQAFAVAMGSISGPAWVQDEAGKFHFEFSFSDIEQLRGAIAGEHDGLSWICWGRLHGGTWFFLAACCDYTGWDCQAGGRVFLADTEAEIRRLMGGEDRDRLGIVLDEEPVRRRRPPDEEPTAEEPKSQSLGLAELAWFEYGHLPENLQEVSKPFSGLAAMLVATLFPGPERAMALRKLLEAKDCAVRAKLRPGC